MPKDVESLIKSKKTRKEFISKFGYVPTSILRREIKKDNAVIDLSYENNRSYKFIAKEQKKKITYKINTKALMNSFGYSGAGVSGGQNKKSVLSIFPQNIGRICLNFYCPENGTVYDPFSGHNSRMQLVYETNRNYIGVDISKTFYKDNVKIKDILMKTNKETLFKKTSDITLYNKSSCNVHEVKSNFADFTITSPPYWDIEFYGDEDKQLGKSKTYKIFLSNIYNHIEENYRILKEGTFSCWFVNDFIKKGKYYSYHSDLIPLFQKAGFELHTIYIVDLGRSMQEMFLNSVLSSKRFPKIHEYCLVFKK